jgi:hypothetical protein
MKDTEKFADVNGNVIEIDTLLFNVNDSNLHIKCQRVLPFFAEFEYIDRPGHWVSISIGIVRGIRTLFSTNWLRLDDAYERSF